MARLISAWAASLMLSLASCAPDYGVELTVDTGDPSAPIFDVVDREAITRLEVFSCAGSCSPSVLDGASPVWALNVLGGEDRFAYGPVIPLPVTYGVVPDAVSGVEPVRGSPDPADVLPAGDYIARATVQAFTYVTGEQSSGTAVFTVDE